MQQLLSGEMGAKSLLSVPIHRMMDELELEIREQKQEAMLRLMAGDDDIVELDEDLRSDSNERLWVDKYRPKKYTDLMGDEVWDIIYIIFQYDINESNDSRRELNQALNVSYSVSTARS